jgi:hypothetical protein
LLEASRKAASLNHEVVNYAMKNRAGVMAGIDVTQEILDLQWRTLFVEFDDDSAIVGAHGNFRRSCHCAACNRDGRGEIP